MPLPRCCTPQAAGYTQYGMQTPPTCWIGGGRAHTSVGARSKCSVRGTAASYQVPPGKTGGWGLRQESWRAACALWVRFRGKPCAPKQAWASRPDQVCIGSARASKMLPACGLWFKPQTGPVRLQMYLVRVAKCVRNVGKITLCCATWRHPLVPLACCCTPETRRGTNGTACRELNGDEPAL